MATVFRNPRWRSPPDFYGSKLGNFLDRSLREFEGTKPSKGTCINLKTSFVPFSVQIGPKLRPVGWPRKLKKEKKTGEESHKTVIFHHHVEAPFRNRSSPKFGEFLELSDIIAPAKYGSKIFISFSRQRGEIKHFPFRIETAYITVPRATALTTSTCESHYKDNIACLSKTLHSPEVIAGAAEVIASTPHQPVSNTSIERTVSRRWTVCARGH